MTLSLVLSLGAAALWGGADFLAGLTSRRLEVLTVVLWAYVAGALAATTVALTTGATISAAGLAWSVGAGVVGCLALWVFYAALAAGTMSVVAPISACGALVPVIVALAGGEPTGLLTALGMAFALGGAVLASRSSADTAGTDEAAGQRRNSARAIGLAVAAAVLIGSVLAIMQQATAAEGTSPIAVIAVARVAGLVAVIALVVGRRVPLGVPAADRRAVAFVGLADTGANGLFVIATDSGHDAVAAVIGSLYPVLTVVLARIVLAERLGRVQAAGVLLAFLGIALVSA